MNIALRHTDISDHTHRTTCRACGGSDLAEVLNLGEQPLANAFLRPNQFADEKRYPLVLYFCRGCSLVQLLDVVRPDILFNKNYVYSNKTIPALHEHFRDYAEKEILPHVGSRDLVVDIGGNDGLLLSFLKDRARVLNVDPAAGPDTVRCCQPFTEALAESITVDGTKRAKVITANNVFAHVDDIQDALRGIYRLLRDDGVFIMEVHWVADLVKRGCFDQIYHEHLCYWSLTALTKVLNSVGLHVVDCKVVWTQGRSLRVTAAKKPYGGVSTADYFYSLERGYLTEEETFLEFGKRAFAKRALLRDLLYDLSGEADCRMIVGYGAPAKGNTLLNFVGISWPHLTYLIDSTPAKQGLYTPGANLLVRHPDTIKEERPDYALLLAWNYADEILKREAELRAAGTKFIVPFPEVTIV